MQVSHNNKMALFFNPTSSLNLPINNPILVFFESPKLITRRSMMMKNNDGNISNCVDSSTNVNEKRKLPILLFDVMDTIVRDPFYEDVPAFFGMSMKELLECKHPTAWNEFEKGLINEDELARKFFKDGRQFDLEGLKTCMKGGYSYLDGVQELLHTLKQNYYEMHAFTNYPIWYEMIEEKLKLSAYLSWTFCSYKIGKQKPDPDFYSEVIRYLEVEPQSCVFVDDRTKNVEGAVNAGMVGLHFKGADVLQHELSQHGVDVAYDELKCN